MKMIQPDAGYFFGIGVFTTLAVEDHHCIFLEEHLKRFNDSLAYFGIETTVSQGDILAYLDKEPLKKGALKITASPGNLCFTPRENPYSPNDYRQGFTLGYSTVMRNETSPFTYHKTLNCGDNIREKKNAKAQGFDEPIFLNSRGEITEGATSNIFFVKNGGLFTPRVSCGLLNGILRQYLIENNTVTEMTLLPTVVKEFDECFVTNSLLGIMPVCAIEDLSFPIGETTKALQKAYERKKHK